MSTNQQQCASNVIQLRDKLQLECKDVILNSMECLGKQSLSGLHRKCKLMATDYCAENMCAAINDLLMEDKIMFVDVGWFDLC